MARPVDEAAQYALRKLRHEGKHKPPPTQEELDLAGYEAQLASGAVGLNVDEHQRLCEAADRSRKGGEMAVKLDPKPGSPSEELPGNHQGGSSSLATSPEPITGPKGLSTAKSQAASSQLDRRDSGGQGRRGLRCLDRPASHVRAIAISCLQSRRSA